MKSFSKITVLFLITSGFAAIACDDDSDNYLDGSLADNYQMGFDTVRIRQYDGELSIEYVENVDQGERVPLRITINTNMVTLTPDTIYDLTKYGAITRGQGYDSAYLPELASGELSLDDYKNEAGATVSGTFDATFDESDGATTTLWGGFNAELEIPDI